MVWILSRLPGPIREVKRGWSSQEVLQEEVGLDLGLKRWTQLFMAENSRDGILPEGGESVKNSGQTARGNPKAGPRALWRTMRVLEVM